MPAPTDPVSIFKDVAPDRTILHCDLDAFFAAVAQRDDPSLRGKPVAVGGGSVRGVVAAASYEARKFGVFSAMPMVQARRRCPALIVVPHDWSAIDTASRGFFRILSDYSPLVEGLSVDEAFLDVTDGRRAVGDGETVARSIKERVRKELGLVASVGVAPSKYIAKIASDIDKPDGLRVVTSEGLFAFLHPLPLSRLWGLGPKAEEKLSDLGLRDIGAVARCPEALLVARLGKLGQHIHALANGHDPRPVVPERTAVSIGHEETFDEDYRQAGQIIPVLLEQADRVAARLRKNQLTAKVVVLKIKYADFRVITRQRSLSQGIADGNLIGRTACELLADVDLRAGESGGGVRLCGVAATHLQEASAPVQLSFDQLTDQRGERIGQVLDSIQDRYGQEAIGRAIYRDRTPRRLA